MAYYIMDMPFESKEVAPDFGTIKMYYVGQPQSGYVEQEAKYRIRGYTLMKKDLKKLKQITNAADGSEATVVDSNEVYILCDGEWTKWAVSTGGSGGTTVSALKWKHM